MFSATAASSNAYFGQLAAAVGPDRVAEMANRLGVSRIAPDGVYGVSVTLGANEVSPLDMAAGYTTLANHGKRPNITPVVRVIRADGSLLEDNTVPVGTQVVHPAIADTTTDILRGVITGGTGRRADIGRPAAGKTGTADDYKAAWFVGYTPQLATAVWIGYADTPKAIYVAGVGNVQGGNIPARTWGGYMRAAHAGLPVIDFEPPGPLPPPRSDGDRPAPRRPNQRTVGSLSDDCGGPCVRGPALPAPAPPTTAAPPTSATAPDSPTETGPPPSPPTTEGDPP
jgi:membrane peptidoglycan carboxypeptidase